MPYDVHYLAKIDSREVYEDTFTDEDAWLAAREDAFLRWVSAADRIGDVCAWCGDYVAANALCECRVKPAREG